MEVDGVADEGRVVQQVEAALEVGHVAPGQQLLPQRGVFAAVTQLGVPETVHHHPRVVVELAERLAADVERLLETRQTHDEEGKEQLVESTDLQSLCFHVDGLDQFTAVLLFSLRCSAEELRDVESINTGSVNQNPYKATLGE